MHGALPFSDQPHHMWPLIDDIMCIQTGVQRINENRTDSHVLQFNIFLGVKLHIHAIILHAVLNSNSLPIM